MKSLAATINLPGRNAFPDLVNRVQLDEHPIVAADQVGAGEFSRAAYFDTANLALLRAGITLRRVEGAGFVLTLPGDDQRVALDAPAGSGIPAGEDGQLAPPESLTALLRARVRGRILVESFIIRTERRVHRLTGADGDGLATIVDDEICLIEQFVIRARMRQVGIEVPVGLGKGAKRRAAAVLAAIADVLYEEGGEPASIGPADLAIPITLVGAAATDPPDEGEPLTASDSDSAAVALTAAIRAQVRRLLAADPFVRLDQPEAIHKMRVATRTLRSQLATFGEFVDPQWARGVRGELRWLAGLLGRARDTDVITGRIDTALADRAGAADIHEVVGDRREEAHRLLAEGMVSPRFDALVELLIKASGEPKVSDLAAELPAAALLEPVEAAWNRYLEAVEALDEQSSDEEFHRARLAAKRARYSIEAVAPLVGKQARAAIKRLAKVQDRLGAISDAVATGDLLTDLAGEESCRRDAVFTLGALDATERARALEARGAFLRRGRVR